MASAARSLAFKVRQGGNGRQLMRLAEASCRQEQMKVPYSNQVNRVDVIFVDAKLSPDQLTNNKPSLLRAAHKTNKRQLSSIVVVAGTNVAGGQREPPPDRSTKQVVVVDDNLVEGACWELEPARIDLLPLTPQLLDLDSSYMHKLHHTSTSKLFSGLPLIGSVLLSANSVRQIRSSRTHILSDLRHTQISMLASFPVKFVTRLMSSMHQEKNNTNSEQYSKSKSPIEQQQATLLANSKCNKKVKVNACGQLYDELAISKPSHYGNAPRKVGIDFEVSYYDSQLDDSSRTGISVCLIHGSPGHYKDFASLIMYLAERGVRVVAPNFPTYSATYAHSFRHSPRERTEFLLSFFKAIHLSHIDMLIGHSGSVYTLFELLQKSYSNQKSVYPPVTISSVGLFNTPSYNLPLNLAVTPFRLFTLKLFDYPLLRPLILGLIHVFVKLQGIQNRVDVSKIEDLLLGASTVGYSDCHNMSEQLKIVRNFKLPTFLLIGCKDKLLPMRCYEQLKRDLGITSDSQVKIYDNNGQVNKYIEQPHELVQVSQFLAGGHYAFQKHHEQVNQDVYDFLTKVTARNLLDCTKL